MSILRLLKCRTINGLSGEPYLQRWSLFRTPLVSAYIHKFVDSDPDRGLHDHPFKWNLSWVLKGFYIEQIEGNAPNSEPHFDSRIRWSMRLFNDRHRHRVILGQRGGEPLECWTLFIHGHRSKGWGFFRGGQYWAISVGQDSTKSDLEWDKAKRGIDG